MSWIAKYRKQRMCALTAAIVAMAWMPTGMAADLPEVNKIDGKNNTQGVNIISDGKNMNIDIIGTGDKAKGVANWDTFSISKGHAVNFTSEKPNWMVLNRVVGNEVSNIMGALNGKGGTVFLINPNGITFGADAKVDVGSLVASTLQITDADFLNDEVYHFSNTKDVLGNTISNIDGKIAIKKEAAITAEDGYVAILAYNIDNSGTITAPNVAMAAGQQIELSYDKKINLRVDVSKDNPAIIGTDNNYVLMRGSDVKRIVEKSIINNKGSIVADGMSKNEKGEIVLTAANVTLGDNSSMSSNGGNITTSAYMNLTVNNGAQVNSANNDQNVVGNWNIIGKDITVSSQDKTNTVSNTVLGKTLNNTSVNINGKNIIVDADINANNSDSGSPIEFTLKSVNMDLAGKISLGKNSIVTTTATDSLQVRDNTEVHAKEGTWNINAKNVVVMGNVGKDETADKENPNRVSNITLGRSLEDTNVNIVASPVNPEYYSDIVVQKSINKEKGQNTSLTLTAGRNIRVDADILSAEGAGALNVTLNSNNQEQTNSTRKDGASIIRANINTNGGNFTTNGSHGTYFGLKRDKTNKEAIGTQRSIITNGGDITLNGNEVLAATGGTVVLDAGNGNIKIAGNVNSANAYYDGGDGNTISWLDARNKARLAGQESGTQTHLAVITGALEDSVATSTIDTDYTKNSQGYVGGHVVKVKVDNEGYAVDKNGNRIKYSTDSNDNPVIVGEPVMDSLPTVINDGTENGKVKFEEFGSSKYKKGWYKIEDANDSSKERYAHFWAWTEGDEAGKIFFVQTIGENIIGNNGTDMEKANSEEYPEWFKVHGFALKTGVGEGVYYTNFAPQQPDADKGHDSTNGSEMALSINYDSHTGGNDVLYSQWNDTCDIKDNVKHYVVEEELGKTSLTINANNVNIVGEVGNLTPLKNVTIDAGGDVKLNDAVKVVGDVRVRAKKDVDVKAINVGNLISMGGDDVTLGDILTSVVQDTDNAIEIFAQDKFINNVGKDVIQLGEDSNSHWKVYSNTPYENTFGGLNSENFAEWNWSGKTSTAAEGNRYIFKYMPTLTFTADNAVKKYGEEISHTGYIMENEMDGKYLDNFLDGYKVLFMNRDGMKRAWTISEGYPAEAKAGVYDINLENTDAATIWGYRIVTNPGKLTISKTNPDSSKEESKDKPILKPDNQKDELTIKLVDENTPAVSRELKPQLDAHTANMVNGTASYTESDRQTGPGADRVLGLQSAELPFFREENGKVKLYGTYDVSVDPDKVKMEPTAKVLPEPDQPKNQYREYDKDLVTKAGTAKFKMTYNGSTFDIYPVDNSAKHILAEGDAAKNVEVESQALFAAFKEMGITLDDLDGVYTHFDSKKEVQSFRR